MKLSIAALLILAISTHIFGQADTLTQQINQQVWNPFIESYNNLDAEGFIKVHSDDIVRINRANSQIRIGAEYFKGQILNAQRTRESNIARKIELRFLERIANKDAAFEIGYYKVEYTYPDKAASTYFGKFHVLLKKINGIWKISMDSDIDLPPNFSTSEFLEASSIDE